MKKDRIIISSDEREHKVIAINEILFWDKKSTPWGKVGGYLKRYIGEVIKVVETEETIRIGNSFSDGSRDLKDTKRVREADARAKANSIQGTLEMIHTSKETSEMENKETKNERKASRGWYRCLARFALPVLLGETNISHYSVYLIALTVRVDRRGILYLCDMMNISKENSIASFV